MTKKLPSNENFSFDIEILKQLHLITRDGKLNHDANRKLKQIEHLCQFISPILENYKEKSCHLIDVGAGKSYLGFLLYDKYFRNQKNFSITGIEHRDELIQNSLSLAKKLQFDRFKFFNNKIENFINNSEQLKNVDVILALHACDTATDDAIKLGLIHSAQYFVLIPCCQAEVAKVLKKIRADELHKSSMSQIYRHPIHTREFGSHLTNVLRCLMLESHGYQVTVSEFTGLEHSLKNEIIIAKKVQPINNNAKKALVSLMKELNIEELNFRFNY